MSLILQLQKLEPGAEIMLFELDGSEFGADVLRFHGHAIPHTPQELAAAGANADQLTSVGASPRCASPSMTWPTFN